MLKATVILVKTVPAVASNTSAACVFEDQSKTKRSRQLNNRAIYWIHCSCPFCLLSPA
jgi:hypothetical protein